jgi:hypothetical protein
MGDCAITTPIFMVWKNEWHKQFNPSPEAMRELVQQKNWQISAQRLGKIS